MARIRTQKRKAGGKPSTWLPPGGLSERLTAKRARQKKNREQQFEQ